MNTYDAALPAGTEPRDGHKPRPRAARPGSGLDAVYASRYTRLEGEVAEGVVLEFTAHHDDGDNVLALPERDAERVDAAIADETPPEARRRKDNDPKD